MTEEVAQHVITEEQGAREVAAAWQLANAEMVKQTQQARDQLAGQLQSFFDNPAKYMEQRAKQVMFDIFANWIQQAEENSPKLQGLFGGIFGQNKVGTGSPGHALGQLFGAHDTGSGQWSVASGQLTTAGSTLQVAGTNLIAASQALFQVSGTAGGPASVGSGGIGSGVATSTAGGGFGGESLGLPDTGQGPGFLSGNLGGPVTGAAGGIGAAAGAASGIAGAAGAGGISSTISQGLQTAQFLRSALSTSGGSAPLLNPSGGFQPTDLPPTTNAGVLGTVPGTGTGPSADTSAGGIGLAGGALTAITGGFALYGGLKSAYDSTSFGSGLLGAASTGLTGAELGFAFGGPIGAGIGAAAGFAAGLFADLFGDHGRSKMQHYNIITVIPSLQKDLDSFSFGGGSYDSASQQIAQLQIQSISQAKQFGSGAMDYYQSVMVPEFTQALAQAQREGAAGRSNVQFGVSQFHQGGDITHFGDLWTTPTTGFIHAELGERVISRMENADSRALSNSASYITSAGARSLYGNGNGSETHIHLHVHAIDSKDTRRWLRDEGLAMIQTGLNQNAGRYAGKALNTR